jgi:calcium/calmodulin-dependent protein kinase (CaM kinase) II
MATDTERELLEINQRLLDSIVRGDWESYVALCTDSITCYEAESRGELVAGLPFHKYYFDLGPSRTPKTVTMCSPHVRLLGTDGAVLCYVRLTQSLDAAGQPQTSRCEETRVWQKIGGAWRHVHFHRSAHS